ncbi:protein DEK [Pleurodeles waltl]|uniref:protein DEK n=1 Tax=Pleurodeles waltl TaxID=8319 RepID=UPI0037095A31
MATTLAAEGVVDAEESEMKETPEEEGGEEHDLELKRDSSDEEETKHKADSEEEEESNEEGYDEEEEKEKSLIVEGKREKKKVERLSLEMSVQKKGEEVVEGKGVKLVDIERVQYFLKKRKSDELRVLHRLLFNRLGTSHLLKKNISQFSGFPFEKDSDQYKKKEEMLKKCKKVMLKVICEVLDLERSGSNGELITRIMNFLMEPKPSGKPLPKSAKKTPPSKGSKKERSSSGSSKKKQPKDKKSNVILSDESSSEEDKKEDTSDEEKESEEEEEPPKKKAKKEKEKEKPKRKSTPKTTPKGKKNVKSAHVKKADSSTTKKNQSNSKKEEVPESESESDSSDDEPLIKKVKKPPTDDELKETVKRLLANANLEEVTMKQICKKVNENYPNDDLSSRKDFIKAVVKELIS